MFAWLDTVFASVTQVVKAAWKKLTASGDTIVTAVRGIVSRAADSRIVRSVFRAVQPAWTKLIVNVESGWQKVLDWFGCDHRSRQVATDKLVAVEAARQLVDVHRGAYATPFQAEAAVQGYRAAYQRVRLPEVRVKLPPPQDLVIVAVGDGWKVMDRASARTVRALHAQRQAGRRQERQGRQGELLKV